MMSFDTEKEVLEALKAIARLETKVDSIYSQFADFTANYERDKDKRSENWKWIIGTIISSGMISWVVALLRTKG